jgi:hypothetical protein
MIVSWSTIMKKELLIIELILVLFSVTFAAAQESYNCSASNILCVDDTPGGTQEYSTIQECANVIQAGQICLVFPGVYEERVTVERSGTASARLTFKAQTSRSALMQGFNVKGKYVRIEGFHITRHPIHAPVNGQTDLNRFGITIYEADYLEIVDNYFTDIVASAVFLLRQDVTGIYIGYNKMHKCAQGIDFSARINFNTVIEHNEITRVYDWSELDNVDHVDNDYIRIGGEGFIVRNNYLHDLNYFEITYRRKNSNGNYVACNTDSECEAALEGSSFCAWDNFCRYNSHVDHIEVVSYASPSEIRYVKNGIIENNIMMDSGMSMKVGRSQLGSDRLSSNITIRNNILAHLAGNAINTGGVDDCKIYNNTIYNAWAHGISLGDTPIPHITSGSVFVKNNLFYENRIFCLCVLGLDNNLTAENNYFYHVHTLDNQNSCQFKLDNTSSALRDKIPYLTNMPILVNPLNIKDIPSPSQFTISALFDQDISVGDILMYKHDGVHRTITNKQSQGEEITLTVDTPLENYSNIYFMVTKQPVRWSHFLEIWKGGSSTEIDFRPTSFFPAMDLGLNLKGEVDTDILGITRPQGSGWDIGAYEFAGEVIPQKPQNLRVK